jgi:uncharacterized protein (DUF58 family)
VKDKVRFISTSIYTIGLFRLLTLVALILLFRQGMQLPAFLILFLLLVVYSARWWSNTGLKGLTVERKIYPQRFFPDEEAAFIFTITNGKRLPAILEWQQSLPPELEVFKSGDTTGYRQAMIMGSGLLLGNTTRTHASTVRVKQRGCYLLPPAVVTSWDSLGLVGRQKTVEGEQWVVVYPRLLAVPELQLVPASLIGKQGDRRPILPDPIRVAGLRDYTPDMPARLIHWKASAHQDQLLARVVEASADLFLLLVVDVAIFLQDNKTGAAAFERALSVAASLACWADSRRIPFGLLVNAQQKGLAGPVSIPVSAGSTQASLVLESLARVELKQLLPFADLLEAEAPHFPWGTTMITIGPVSCGQIIPGIRRVLAYPWNDLVRGTGVAAAEGEGETVE